ncbi:hypothetical protein BC939DRAFT_505790 [Gamsiella multidivaricata]|uniref:uncharacterized protein n=1 Tax=Gamsiella multidivaricata TaxID=101098 RepID=UPI00221F2276|nr:uncharacterized protein BC939DRAFT_505790 [Gamsiella multidivaricata]KAI7819446.1 hypothetical protein BC939DRAFT_505790 [Gamsiella multidivaricata]
MATPHDNTSKAIAALDLREIIDLINFHVKIKRHIVKALRVCKAWHEAWTPVLWKDIEFDCKTDTFPTAELFAERGHFVRKLTLENPKDHHLASIMPFLGNLRDMRLDNSKVTIEGLTLYMKELGGNTDSGREHALRLLCLDNLCIEASDLVPVLREYCGGLETWMDDAAAVINRRLECLGLDEVTQSDNCFFKLLGRCPNLQAIHIAVNPLLTNAAVYRIPELCPKVDDLCHDSNSMVTSPSLTQLFQRSVYPLRLQTLALNGDAMDDRLVDHIARSQGGSLTVLNLAYCNEVTDEGVESILEHCCQLQSLSHLDTAFTTAIMDSPQERWKCFNNLQVLDIRNLELPQGNGSPTNELEEFAKVKRRIMMLPKLRKLAMDFFGLYDKLVLGFGCGDGQGPRLQTLDAHRDVSSKGLRGEELDRFLDNYPYLRCLIVDKSTLNHCEEMIPRLGMNGVRYDSARSVSWAEQ